MVGYTQIPAADLPQPGSMKTLNVKGKVLAIANVDGEYFAVDDICSHEHCSLGSDGALDGTTVICGCHGAMFDVTTGGVMSLPAVADVGSYVIKKEKGEVYIKL